MQRCISKEKHIGGNMAVVTERVKQLTEKFLRKELYVIIGTPSAPHSEQMRLLPDHLEYQIKLEKAGVIFAAGPMFNADGTEGPGLVIIRAASFEAAKAIADGDPWAKAGVRTYSITRWLVYEGSYSVRINYSDQTVAID
jgi:uncharacterized protein YciI